MIDYKLGDMVVRKIGGKVLEVVHIHEKGVAVRNMIRDSNNSSKALSFCLVRPATKQEVEEEIKAGRRL